MRPWAKLTDQQVLDIARRYDEGDVTMQALAREYRVSPTTIWRIAHSHRQPDTSGEYVQRERHITPVGSVVRARLVKPLVFGKRDVFVHGEGEYKSYGAEVRRMRYSIEVQLSGEDAAPLVRQIEQEIHATVQSETACLESEGALQEINAQLEAESMGLMTRLGAAEYRPYKKQDDGSYVFDFKTKPTVSVPSRGKRATAKPPRLTNAAGNKLRKPERISKGSRVRVSYELYTWSHLGEDRERFDQFSATLTTYDPEKNWRSLGVGVTLSLQGVELVEIARP